MILFLYDTLLSLCFVFFWDTLYNNYHDIQYLNGRPLVFLCTVVARSDLDLDLGQYVKLGQ